MADKKAEKERRKRRGGLSITAIYKDLSFSKDGVVLWVKVPPAQYEFKSYKDREGIAVDFDYALASILNSEEKPVECHLIGTTRVFDTAQWVMDLYNINQENNPSPYLETFLGDMYEYVDEFNFRTKLVLLGVKLGERRQYQPTRTGLGGEILNQFATFVATGTNADYLTDKEAEYWDRYARNTRVSLNSSAIQAETVTPQEIAYVIRKSVFPAMPLPSPEDFIIGDTVQWGEGELSSLLEAEIENAGRWLKITQEVNGRSYTGFRATLAFAKYPDSLSYPDREPWIHSAASLGFPTDFYSRFTLEPSRKVRKEVDRKLKEVKDQAVNQTSAGGQMNLDVQERLEQGEVMEYALTKDNTPWVFGRHRIVVEAPTLEELRDRAQQLIDHYRSLDIMVTWPTGDQYDLWLESMPSDKVRLSSYYQRQALSIISAGVPAGSGGAGDVVEELPDGETRGWLGQYLGHTTSRVAEPVFLSIQSTIARNKPPAFVITGAPGQGKSFCAFTMTYAMALSGVWTIYIDPKADAVTLPQLPGMEGAAIIDLAEGESGILDPFAIAENSAERKNLSFEVIGLFLGGLNAIDPDGQAELSKAIEIVADAPVASLRDVVSMLLQNKDSSAARAIGHRLKLIMDVPFARLAFGSPEQGARARALRGDAAAAGLKLRPENGLTIITLQGLDLPSSSLPKDSYSNANRLAVGIMYLLTTFTSGLMRNRDKSHPKCIVVDEAWAVTSTPQGAKMVIETARMGRSLNTGLLLVSQNAGDFLGEGVTNSVSTKIAFGSKDTNEITNILTFLGLDPTNDGDRDAVRDLRQGECLIADATGDRVARVKVDDWNAAMTKSFETNPTRRKAQAA